MFALIKQLTEIAGPCGQEEAITSHMRALWRDGGFKTRQSPIGNVVARVGGKGKKLLLAAHGDELTFLVRDIHPDGFLWLANGQGWTRTWSQRNAFTIGQNVTVMARSGPLDGFIGAATGHIAAMALPEPNDLTWNDFWVETGMSAQQLADHGVTPGTRVIWRAETVQRGSFVTGKALDDRASLAVMTTLGQRLAARPKSLKWDVSLGCTIQEEIGLIGASAMATREQFDAVIIVEIGLAGDIPAVTSHALPLRLGAGPALIHKDSAVHYDYALTRRLEMTAADARVPIQHAVLSAFGSDGVTFMRADMPTAMIVFPARYTHTPFETAHIGDLNAMVDWLEAFVTL
jgi:endoglucanase